MTPNSDLFTRIAISSREQGLFEPDDTLIIGLSGGADSTALLDLLAGLPGTPLHLIAAHLNHGLRGAESDADEEFCQQLAGQYRIPFESRRVDVKSIADKNSLNLEDAGRQARIAFFDELRITRQANAVALAHHADDQAETILMRLLRGSGMTGLSGISSCNGRGYVRPLLGITRAEIENHLRSRGLAWREDSSNSDTTFLRSRIRHELLPLLEQYNPSVRTCLTTTASILSSENELLADLAEQAAGLISLETTRGITCNITLLNAQPPALQRRIIRLALFRLHGNLEQFSYQHITAICHMATGTRSNSRISLPQGIVAVKEYDTLLFKSDGHLPPLNIDLDISGPGTYQLHGSLTLAVEPVSAPENLTSTDSTTAYFDLDRCPFPWHVRTFLPGDHMQPLGMTGRKKVKDIFIDSKTPPSQRRQTPLVFCKETLIWVCGLRTSQHARLEGRSSSIVKVVFSRTE